MKPTKLSWMIALVLGTCAAPALAQEPAPPVPVEKPAEVAGEAHESPMLAGETKEQYEARLEAEAEARQNAVQSNYINWFDIHWSGKDYFGGTLGDGKMEFANASGQIEIAHEEEEKMSPPFVFMLINFGIFLLLLAKYLAPAGKKLAEERHDTIKNALDEAAKLRKQAQDKLAEYDAKLAKADAEIAEMVAGMKADAEAEKQRMLKAADDAAALLKRDAETRIAAEIALARAALTKEVTAAAASATEKLLRDKATADDQSKLVNTFIAGVQHVAIRGDQA